MRTYKPSKRPLAVIYIVLFLILLLIKYAMNIVNRFVPFSVDTYIQPVWIIVSVFAVFILPIYFFKSYFTVSSTEITVKAGLIITTKQFMPASSVKSVTAIMMPFNGFTAMNFVVINALGSRVVMPFLSKKNAIEITAVINHSIRTRNKDFGEDKDI